METREKRFVENASDHWVEVLVGSEMGPVFEGMSAISQPAGLESSRSNGYVPNGSIVPAFKTNPSNLPHFVNAVSTALTGIRGSVTSP